MGDKKKFQDGISWTRKVLRENYRFRKLGGRGSLTVQRSPLKLVGCCIVRNGEGGSSDGIM